MNLTKVNELLYQTLDDIINPDTDADGNVINEVTPEKAKAITGVANAIVNNAKVQLEAVKEFHKGNLTESGQLKAQQFFLTE